MSEIKRLEVDQNSFNANGKKYLIHGSLTVARFEIFEKLQVDVGFGSDFDTLYKGVSKAYGLLNTMKVADASVELYNIMSGVARNMEKRQHPMLLMCTLFINYEGEDMSVWTETEANEKIADWKADGYAVEDFFRLAFSSVAGYSDAYQEIIRNISRKDKEKAK